LTKLAFLPVFNQLNTNLITSFVDEDPLATSVGINVVDYAHPFSRVIFYNVPENRLDDVEPRLETAINRLIDGGFDLAEMRKLSMHVLM